MRQAAPELQVFAHRGGAVAVAVAVSFHARVLGHQDLGVKNAVSWAELCSSNLL